MNYLRLALPLLLLSSVGYAQDDHLMPEQGYFSSYTYQDEYYSRVRHILLDSLTNKLAVQIVIMPSFVSEYMLAIEQGKTNTEFVLVYRTVSRSIWSEQYRDKNYATIQVQDHRANLPQPLASQLVTLFQVATSQTRYPEERRIGGDGVNYHVAANKYGWRSGYTWSPRQGSLMGQLVAIIEQLPQVASHPEQAMLLEKLSTGTQELLGNLQKAKK